MMKTNQKIQTTKPKKKMNSERQYETMTAEEFKRAVLLDNGELSPEDYQKYQDKKRSEQARGVDKIKHDAIAAGRTINK
jgi:hypothetical protein